LTFKHFSTQDILEAGDLMFLKMIFLLFPFRVQEENTNAQVQIDETNFEAIWVPCDWEGPIVAAEFDQKAF
jgi:hypothetical protein